MKNVISLFFCFFISIEFLEAMEQNSTDDSFYMENLLNLAQSNTSRSAYEIERIRNFPSSGPTIEDIFYFLKPKLNHHIEMAQENNTLQNRRPVHSLDVPRPLATTQQIPCLMIANNNSTQTIPLLLGSSTIQPSDFYPSTGTTQSQKRKRVVTYTDIPKRQKLNVHIICGMNGCIFHCSSSYQMTRHKKTPHVKPWRCIFCLPTIFITHSRAAHIQHVIEKHSDERICKFCYCNFSSLTNLREHILRCLRKIK